MRLAGSTNGSTMGKSTPFLYQKRGIFYLQKRVPKKLIPMVGRAFVRVSLRTKDRATAIYPRVLRRQIFITALAPTPMQMAANMLVNSRMVKFTDKALSPLAPIQNGRAINMSVNSKMVKGMGKAPSPLQMEEKFWVHSKVAI